jgi:hypothetical protein
MKTCLLALLFAATLCVSLPAADSAATKASPKKSGRYTPTVLPDIEGVSKEDMVRVRAAFLQAYQDPAIKAAKERLAELKGNAEFASASEKKDMRSDFENAIGDLHKATKAALTKADATLSRELIEKVMDAMEAKGREKAAGAMKKEAKTATPLKPFPFGDKAKETPKPEAK